MSEIEGTRRDLELLVNCKTYPAVSEKYVETVCTGGVDADGKFVRLYPIPFRFLEKEEQYNRWDIIKVRAYKSRKDTRPESWHFVHGSPIHVVGRAKTNAERWQWMQSVVFQGSEDLERQNLTNGLVEIKPLKFWWAPDEVEWTESQKRVIQQGNLFFKPEEIKAMAERVPWQYRIKYQEVATGRQGEGKVLAWSYYVGYLRQKLIQGDDAAALTFIQKKVESSIFNPKNRVYAILGTHSRFGSWMISSLYHVPRSVCDQGSLL